MHRHLAAVLGCTHSDVKAAGTAVLLPGRRVPTPRHRAPPRHHPGRRAAAGAAAVSPEQLAQAALQAAKGVAVAHPLGMARWGEQIDVQILDRAGKEQGAVVAGYVAKYATKSSDDSGALDMRIRSARDLAQRRLPAHLHRMAEVAWELGGEAAYERWRLQRHAHSLGYGGHFLSKSKGYSTTFGALRAARQRWQVDRARNETQSDNRSPRARWRAVGIGWANDGEATWAEAQRRSREEEKRCALEDFYSRKRSDRPPSETGERYR